MDIDVALMMLREALDTLRKTDCSKCAGAVTFAVEAFNALDDWMSDGGFPPAEWASGLPL
jgi:hypothetical protein